MAKKKVAAKTKTPSAKAAKKSAKGAKKKSTPTASPKAAAPAKKAAKKSAKPVRRVKSLPLNMTSNQSTVGKGHVDEAVPAVAKRVKKKSVKVGKGKQVIIPVRTGVGGGRPGGGGTGELSPTTDTAAGRGYGKKRKKR